MDEKKEKQTALSSGEIFWSQICFSAEQRSSPSKLVCVDLCWLTLISSSIFPIYIFTMFISTDCLKFYFYFCPCCVILWNLKFFINFKLKNKQNHRVGVIFMVVLLNSLLPARLMTSAPRCLSRHFSFPGLWDCDSEWVFLSLAYVRVLLD